MKGDKRKIWIEAGYRRFAMQGEAGLTVESISRELGKNKSSFYHYFGELAVLKADILKRHIEQSKSVGNKVSVADALDPDVFQVIIDHKEDFLFHKQLKLQSDTIYQTHYERAYELVESPLVDKISEALGLKDKQFFSNALLRLASDNFLLRIQDSNLTMGWLREYIKELKSLSRHLK